jgi:uncharacterized membrane protein YccC
MDNPSPISVRLWLETAASALKAIDAAWTVDANTVADVARALDTHPMRQMRHLADPKRLQQLHQTLALVEWLLDDIADADTPAPAQRHLKPTEPFESVASLGVSFGWGPPPRAPAARS